MAMSACGRVTPAPAVHSHADGLTCNCLPVPHQPFQDPQLHAQALHRHIAQPMTPEQRLTNGPYLPGGQELQILTVLLSQWEALPVMYAYAPVTAAASVRFNACLLHPALFPPNQELSPAPLLYAQAAHKSIPYRPEAPTTTGQFPVDGPSQEGRTPLQLLLLSAPAPAMYAYRPVTPADAVHLPAEP